MPQMYSSRSSQLDMTAPTLPTINIAEGRPPGQQRPLTMTPALNDENKQALALTFSPTHPVDVYTPLTNTHTHMVCSVSCLKPC